MGLLDSALKIIAPRAIKKGGTSITGTTTPANATAVLGMPGYQDHLTDIYTLRQSSDARALIQQLIITDPDVGAALSAYLTIAGASEPLFLAKNLQGQPDSQGQTLLQQTLLLLTSQFDYTQGFDYQPSLSTICEQMRFMLLATGSVMAELVFDKNLAPNEIRFSDPQFIFWYEKLPGKYKPEQRQSGLVIELDIPSFFVAFHHKDPRTIYAYSTFTSAINTIAARQQIANDIYRIMKITGYPRMDVTVLEEVITKNMPADIKKNANDARTWLNARMAEIRSGVENIRPDQALVHWDSATFSMMNEKAAGMAINMDSIITILNGQNQAALKVMGTIIGRGESGVNTASVEARVFSMNCDDLNKPVAEMLSNVLTLALRVQGFQGYVEAWFPKAEMRSELELEPQLIQRSSRLMQALSLGLISDEEFHIKMFGRPAPANAPTLQGTGFMQPQTSNGNVDPSEEAANKATSTSSASNSLGRAVAPKGSKSAASNAVKKVPAK